jgi:hypothetical protein
VNTASSQGKCRLRWLLIALAVLSAGCTHVPAWQRGGLADPCMQWDRHPDRAALRKHVVAVREGVPPTEAGGGGACGCD